MIYNPIVNPLFLPTAIRILVILLLLFLAALWRRVNAAKSSATSTMLSKIITVAWVAPILLFALFCGGLVLAVVVGLVLVEGLAEYTRLVDLGRRYSLLLAGYSIITLVLSALRSSYIVMLMLPFGLFLISTLIPILSGETVAAHRQVGSVMFGYLYIGIGLSSIVFIRATQKWGLEFLIIVGTAIALSDAGGYIVGSSVKGPRLVPRVSPGKTWSGLAGSLLGVITGIAIQWFARPSSWKLYIAILLAFAVTVGSVWGDLIESFVKRNFGVKDAGDVLRGFGGVLDRFDSFLVAVPLAYAVVLAAI